MRTYASTCNRARRDWLRLRTLTSAVPTTTAATATVSSGGSGGRSGLRKTAGGLAGGGGELDGAVGALREFVVQLETELVAMQDEFGAQPCMQRIIALPPPTSHSQS